MVRFKNVEMSEGVYAALWSAVLKTGDADTIALWKEVVHKEQYPVMHYVIEKGLYFGFLDDIQKYKVPVDINAILQNTHIGGYYLKHYKRLNCRRN